MSFPEFSSETAVTMYLWQLIPHIAQRLGILQWQFLAINEQLEAISDHSKAVGDALREYLKLYSQWATEDRSGREASQAWAKSQEARAAVVSAVDHATKAPSAKRRARSPKKSKGRG